MKLTWEEFLFHEEHTYLRTFIRLYAFADFYDTPQLRQDVMTLLVELTTHNNYNKGCTDQWSWSVIEELYDSLPSTSPICQFAVKRRVVHSYPNKMTKEKYECYPQSFLIDLLLIAVPVRGSTIRRLKEEVCDCCNFHEHEGDKKEMAACKLRQQEYGLWFASFLRACMSEVYDIEDAALEEVSNGETEDKLEHEAAVPEEKVHSSVPLPAGVEMTNKKVEVDRISGEGDNRLDAGLLMKHWEELEAHDDYEILIHSGQ